MSLADHPKLLVGVNFEADTKRGASEVIVDRLRRDEHLYRDLVIDLLIRLSQFDERFLDLQKAERTNEKEGLVAEAKSALAEVKAVIAHCGELAEERRRISQEIDESLELAELKASHSSKSDQLKTSMLIFNNRRTRKPGGLR